MAHVPYTNVVDNYIHVMMCIWQNICYTIGVVNKISRGNHWKIVKKILRYLEEITNNVLFYQYLNLQLRGYNDIN